jgi:hypothetical protein
MLSVTIEVRFVVVSSTIVCKNEKVTAASLQFHRPPHFVVVMIEVSLVFVNGR